MTKTFSKCGKFAGNFSEKVLECPLIQTDLHNGHKTAETSLQNVDYREHLSIKTNSSLHFHIETIGCCNL